MSDVLTYVVPGRPTSWKRGNIVRGRPVTAAGMSAAKRAHAWAATKALADYAAMGRKPRSLWVGTFWPWTLDAEYRVDVVAYMPSRGSLPDIDNVMKLALDAMQGIVYADDRQVREGSVCRLVDADAPRTEVTVTRLAVDPVMGKTKRKRGL